ncbi:hypothetical protein H4Q26_017071 [Puccinia striiformis f. sp. tritici PST-130]|nr:hypothetical protein H4Q26_017071 [Puccinia striiformis f. sp. tritici PST-130]
MTIAPISSVLRQNVTASILKPNSIARQFSSSSQNFTKVLSWVQLVSSLTRNSHFARRGIGQPLSLAPWYPSFSLRRPRIPGVAADVSHINTASTCKGYLPQDGGLEKALEGAQIVLVPAGVPRKPGMTRDDLFNMNASIAADLATAAAKVCPKPTLIIANPVNSTVPIVGEVFKKHNVFDPKRLFGVTTLDVVRASASCRTSPNRTLRTPTFKGHREDYKALVKRIQFGGDEVVQAKDGAGIIEPTFVKSHLYEKEGVEYFASNVELGPEGVGKILPIGSVSQEEQELINACLPELKKNIEKGVQFVQGRQ